MEAKDLMIDNWVYRPDCYDRVKEIRTNGIIGLDSLRGLIPFKGIKPIPLTPEILEKNDFHKEWDDDIILMVCDTIIVEIGNRYKLYKDGKMYLRRVLSPLYYVHQLQHALRLCNIDKEIVL